MAAGQKKRARIEVVYEDGSTDSFNPNKPAFLLAMERKFGVSVPEKHEHIAWLSWYALGQPADNLDKWLGTVEYIDEQPGDDFAPAGQGEPDQS